MKRYSFLIVLLLCLMLVFHFQAACGEVDYHSTYETAIKLAGNDLTDLDSLQDSMTMLEQTGAYAYSKSYLMYFQALLEIQKGDDLDTAGLRLENCNRQAEFVADLEERNLPSCEELIRYIEARRLESEGKTEEAHAVFVELTLLDSPERAFNLSLDLAKATPEPTQEEMPAMTPEPARETGDPEAEAQQASASVPILSEVYPGSEAHLRIPGNKDQRVFATIGPGKSYASAGGYKPSKQKKITVYFEEDGYVFADVVYQTSEERFVYLPRTSFDSIGEIPVISDPVCYEGTANADIAPSWGPDNRFNAVNALTVEAGAAVKVFFQENGFVYAEYVCGKGTVRMWLPAENIETRDATVTYSTTPVSPAGQSSFK